MPLIFVRNDITKMKVDAIVNTANSSLLGGAGVDGAIHAAAGPELLEECKKLNDCPIGGAKITGAYHLPSKYVIHAVGPVWRGGKYGEEETLVNCYNAAMKLADEHQCETIAFPLISSGAYGYPKHLALETATKTIRAYLNNMLDEMLVYLVVFDRDSLESSAGYQQDIEEFIDDEYAFSHYHRRRRRNEIYGGAMESVAIDERKDDFSEMSYAYTNVRPMGAGAPLTEGKHAEDLSDYIRQMDAGFSETLLKLIDEKNMTDVECYKRANIDRKLFSKIRSNREYRPSRETVIAFAIALKLNLEEMQGLMETAGYVLSKSSKFDMIIRHFVERGDYDADHINLALCRFDQKPLGNLIP